MESVIRRKASGARFHVTLDAMDGGRWGSWKEHHGPGKLAGVWAAFWPPAPQEKDGRSLSDSSSA